MSEHDESVRPESKALAHPRPAVDALEEVLGRRWPVLDDGFVRVIDYMGTDASIVQAARVSYGAGTKRLREDEGLIRYLMRHSHTTPFEMCELKLHVRVPMDCWRQWIRHRTASVNEYSTRYSEAIDATQKTQASEWRTQSDLNKQGSGSYLASDLGEALSLEEARLHDEARRVYAERLATGVAREQARKDLPLSTYTEAYWKIDLHNLFHFLRLRLDSHAQNEIRQYATVIGYEIVSRWCPIAWQAFLDYQFHGLTLSSLERSIVNLLVRGETNLVSSALAAAGIPVDLNKRSRERDDLENKLKQIGLTLPWRTQD